MIAYLDFNRFPQNSVEADLDFRDLQCQLFNNIISDSVFSDFQRQPFINIEADSDFSQFLSSILQLNIRMVANKVIHRTIQAKLRRMIQAKLRQNQVTPATIRNDSFKLIDTLASEGAASKDSFKFIVESILEGARFAPTTFQTSINGFQLVVEFNPILHSEGALFAPYSD